MPSKPSTQCPKSTPYKGKNCLKPTKPQNPKTPKPQVHFLNGVKTNEIVCKFHTY
jgi:hypothetical protein